jgi:hypothetical protein
VVLDGFDGDSLLGATHGVERALLRRFRPLELVALGRVRRRRDGGSVLRAVRRELAVTALGPHLGPVYRRLRGTADTDPPPAWLCPPLSDRLREVRSNAADWKRAQLWIYSEGFERGIESWDRIGLAAGVEILHPLADRELVEFCLRLAPEVKLAHGLNKAVVRLGFPELPALVTGRLDKPLLDSPWIDAAHPLAALAALAKSPQLLPGVNWASLRHRLESGAALSGPDAASLRLVLQADHILGCSPTAFASAA